MSHGTPGPVVSRARVKAESYNSTLYRGRPAGTASRRGARLLAETSWAASAADDHPPALSRFRPLCDQIRGSLPDCSPYLVRLRLARLSCLIRDLDPIVGSEIPRPVGRGLEWVKDRLFPKSGLPGFALVLHGTPRLISSAVPGATIGPTWDVLWASRLAHRYQIRGK